MSVDKPANVIAQPQSIRSEVKDGMADAAPILLAVVPFAAVFGALAIEQGLTFGQMMLTSMTIYAGASQYAMVELLGQNVPAWSIVLTVFAINFRHVLYSASIGRHLGAFSFPQKALALFLMVDPQYASSEARAQTRVLRPSYYFGYASLLYVTWMGGNIVGGLFGTLMENPAAFGFDFILPLYFTGLILGFRTRPRFLAVLIVSVVASLAVYFTLGSPWHITLGGLAGLVLAAATSKPDENVLMVEEEASDAT